MIHPVTEYVISRGLRVSFLIVLCLGITAMGYLLPIPTNGGSVLLRLVILLAALIWAFQKLRSAALSFFLASFFALPLFQKPLDDYVSLLYGQATSQTVFMIVIFGGALTLVSRSDLLEELDGIRSSEQFRSPAEERLRREAAIFCLLRRFDRWVQSRVRSGIGRGVLLAPLVFINFVSSSTAVLFFKSVWAPTQKDFVNREEDRAVAAGILCLCTSGCLVFPYSTWWLFFQRIIQEGNPDWMPRIPVGVYFYGLLSFVHGFRLIFCRSQDKTGIDDSEATDIKTRQLGCLYLWVLFSCVLFILISFGAPTGLRWLGTDPDNSTVACTLFIGLILAFLLAQSLMYALYVRPANEAWAPGSFWGLMMKGMSGVFGTVVTLVVLLAFKDIIWQILKNSEFDVSAFPALKVFLPLLALVGSLLVGRVLGSSWGTFALGFLVFTLASVKDPVWGPTVVEALILAATFINQRSPNADNAQMMLGVEACTPEAMKKIWSVPTFPRYSRIRAEYVQWAILGVGVIFALVARWKWPNVF